MKDTNQKTKEAKKFRLHSILKLHTRIMNQKLMIMAIQQKAALESIINSHNTSEAVKILKNLSLDFITIGKHNHAVSEMANTLQLTSSQEELQALFKLVTKPDEKTREELESMARKCKCKKCTTKREAKQQETESSTSKVTTKVIEIVASSKEEALEKFNQLVKEGKIV